MRIGTGYDVHRLAEGRDLILGGVRMPYSKGLLGHSDADVVLHAIMDALLGAAALGDIGRHFPDTDPAYEGISSIILLKKVKALLEDKLYLIENIDATIIAQKPKLAPFLPEMEKNIAQALGIEEERVNMSLRMHTRVLIAVPAAGARGQSFRCNNKMNTQIMTKQADLDAKIGSEVKEQAEAGER